MTYQTDPCTGYAKKIMPYISARSSETDAMVTSTTAGGPGATTYIQMRSYGNGGATGASGAGDLCKPPRQACQRKICCPPERRTVCVEYPERRKNCYKNDPRPWQQLYADAFDGEFSIGFDEEDIWHYFTNEEGFVANDGKVRVARDGLSLTARNFSKTYHKNDGKFPCVEDGFLDHFKAFMLLNSEFPVPDCGQLYAQAWMAGRTFNTEMHCFGDNVIDPTSDLRLAHCAFSMLDFETGLHISFAITNDAYYAVYEVLPIDYEEAEEGDSGVKASFAGAFMVQRRNHVNPLQDFAHLGLALDKRKGATWYINGNQVHNEPALGALPKHSSILYQIAGEPKPLDVRCVRVGFGLFTMLDAFPPEMAPSTEKSRVGLVRLTNFRYCSPFRKNDGATFVRNQPAKKELLFGQGAAMKVKKIEVEFRC